MREKGARASGKLCLICKLGNFTVTHTDWGDRKRGAKRGFTTPCSGLQLLPGSQPSPCQGAPTLPAEQKEGKGRKRESFTSSKTLLQKETPCATKLHGQRTILFCKAFVWGNLSFELCCRFSGEQTPVRNLPLRVRK